jgi:hypothetical protein
MISSGGSETDSAASDSSYDQALNAVFSKHLIPLELRLIITELAKPICFNCGRNEEQAIRWTSEDFWNCRSCPNVACANCLGSWEMRACQQCEDWICRDCFDSERLRSWRFEHESWLMCGDCYEDCESFKCEGCQCVIEPDDLDDHLVQPKFDVCLENFDCVRYCDGCYESYKERGGKDSYFSEEEDEF